MSEMKIEWFIKYLILKFSIFHKIMLYNKVYFLKILYHIISCIK